MTTRYCVSLNLWRKGDFEKCREFVQNSRDSGLHVNVEKAMEEYSKKFEYILWAESKEEAIEMGLLRAGYTKKDLDCKMSSLFADPVPYLTLAEVLKAPVLYSDYGYLPMMNYLYRDLWLNFDVFQKIEDEKRVRVDIIYNASIDGRRGRTLGVLYFDNAPVCVFQRAGRENDDHKKEWVASLQTLARAKEYVHSLIPVLDDRDVATDLHQEIPELSIFYGGSVAEEV